MFFSTMFNPVDLGLTGVVLSVKEILCPAA